MAYEFMTPQEAWETRVDYRQHIASYSGDRVELNATSNDGMFWKRQSRRGRNNGNTGN